MPQPTIISEKSKFFPEKIKIDKKILINKKALKVVLIGVCFLSLVFGYFLLEKTGKLGNFNLGLFLAKLTPGNSEKENSQLVSELNPNQIEINLPSSASQTKKYEQVAQVGEGITHLARKALKEYIKEKKLNNIVLTPEHKIYIEDYLQNKIGDRWLQLGEKISFSEELILEAINKSQQLSSNQLENLKQYSAKVIFE